MKKMYLLAVVASLVMVACEKEEIEVEKIVRDTINICDTVTVHDTITAVIEKPVFVVDTSTSLLDHWVITKTATSNNSTLIGNVRNPHYAELLLWRDKEIAVGVMYFDNKMEASQVAEIVDLKYSITTTKLTLKNIPWDSFGEDINYKIIKQTAAELVIVPINKAFEGIADTMFYKKQ